MLPPPDATKDIIAAVNLLQAQVVAAINAIVGGTPPDATEIVKGILKLATQAEVTTGTDDTKAITPLKLAVAVPAASETATGKIEIATQAEVTTGTDDLRAVTPLKLAVAVPAASEIATGKIEIATQAEVTTGTDDVRAVTPLKLAVAVPAASETAQGKIEIATQAEITTGTDDVRAVTPLKLAVAVPSASETVQGKIEIATQGEVSTGTDDVRAVTPLKLKTSFKGYTIGGSVNSFAPVDLAVHAIGHNVTGTVFGTIQRRYIPRAGTITAVFLHWSATTAGTDENIVCSVRLNNTTDTAVATIGNTNAQKLFSNVGLNIDVAISDYIELKLACPTWATNPLGVTLTYTIYIEL